MNKRLVFLVAALAVTLVAAAAIAFTLFLPFPSPHPSAEPSLSATPPQTQTPASSPTLTVVAINDDFFSPSNLTVPAGTTVEWVNNGVDIHTTTSFAPGGGGTGFLWNSDILQPGQRYSYTFTQPGTYDYYCGVHATSMFGRVTVVSG